MTTKPAAPPPPAAAPPPARGGPAIKKSPRATIPSAIGLTPTTGPLGGPDRIVIYGTGGIGKSTLAAFLPAPLFIDLEDGTGKLNVMRDRAATWEELRGKLAGIEQNPPQGVRTVVIDSATVAEQLAAERVIATRRTEKGAMVDSIDGFGWGKGWQFVDDEFGGLLADLDRLKARGLYTCFIAHVVTADVPNPNGDNFLRWEPLLYKGDKQGRAAIRERVKNWSEHVLFLGYDVYAEGGKAQGSGTRTIYATEMPTHMAKTRGDANGVAKVSSMSYDLSDPGAVWRALGIV